MMSHSCVLWTHDQGSFHDLVAVFTLYLEFKFVLFTRTEGLLVRRRYKHPGECLPVEESVSCLFHSQACRSSAVFFSILVWPGSPGQ